jgi:hypothetical protein
MLSASLAVSVLGYKTAYSIVSKSRKITQDLRANKNVNQVGIGKRILNRSCCCKAESCSARHQFQGGHDQRPICLLQAMSCGMSQKALNDAMSLVCILASVVQHL